MRCSWFSGLRCSLFFLQQTQCPLTLTLNIADVSRDARLSGKTEGPKGTDIRIKLERPHDHQSSSVSHATRVPESRSVQEAQET